MVCTVCGACQETLALGAVSFAEFSRGVVGEDARDLHAAFFRGCRPARKGRPQELRLEPRKRGFVNKHLTRLRERYKPCSRLGYLRERLAQWSRTEPRIPPADWEVICNEFVEWARERGYLDNHVPTRKELRKRGRVPGTLLLSKDEVREILLRCDRHASDPQPQPGDYNYGVEPHDPDFIRFGRFRERYLEKWLTIRWRLSGVGTAADDVPATVLDEVIELFQKCMPAFRAVVYERGVRTSFIGYNFVLCRLFDLLGFSHCNEDFPTLKTPKRQRVLQEFWKKICAFNLWPYINSDELPQKKQKR